MGIGKSRFRKVLLNFLLLSWATLSAHAEQNFCILTIPKCGTGLINKFFEITTDLRQCPQSFRDQLCGPNVKSNSFSVETVIQAEDVEFFFKRCKNNSVYPFGHLNYAIPFLNYIDTHPEYQCVLQIRDLRDACISMVFWKKEKIDEVLGKTATFDEALLFVIQGSNSLFQNKVFNIKASAERAVLIMNHPNVIISRYEDLVGARGEGVIRLKKN